MHKSTEKRGWVCRPVVYIFTPDNLDVGAEMIKAGMAWHFKSTMIRTTTPLKRRHGRRKLDYGTCILLPLGLQSALTRDIQNTLIP